jgi:glycogen phosphorylase
MRSERHGASLWHFSVPVYLGEIESTEVAVQLYADSDSDGGPFVGGLARGEAIIGAANGHVYSGSAPSTRPAEDYTVRISPCYSGARVPTELPLILWQK